MKKIIFILCILSTIIPQSCKKTDKNTTPTKTHNKSPVKYLRINGVDGELILSVGLDHFRDTITNSHGTFVDSVFTLIRQEIYGYFPGSSDAAPLLGAGNIYFNYHNIIEGPDSSYLLENYIDTFNFDTTTAFRSNWSVQGSSSVPGFSDTFSNNRFPTAFNFQIDSVIHQSAGYIININTGGALNFADSIIYYIYDIYNPSTFVLKSISGIGYIGPVNFLSSDLAVFTPGTNVTIEVVAYNYRLAVKNGGTQNIYFINQRRFSNLTVGVRS